MAKDATVKVTSRNPGTVDNGEETFEFTLADGSKVICGKPKGVMKIKLREMLDADLLRDPEISTIAQAFLSIRSVAGQPLWIRTYNEFVAFMDRFGSDERLDEFMEQYQRLVNPGLAAIIEKVMEEAKSERLTAEQLQERITERVMEHEVQKRQKVKNS